MEPRETRTLGHGGEAAHAGTPQGLQQESLQLVVRMLGQEQEIVRPHHFPKSGVAPFPGHGLQALARSGLHPHAPGLQRDAEGCTGGFTMTLPFIRLRVEAVVHVQRPKLAGQVAPLPSQRREQHHGIEPAAQGHPITPRGREAAQSVG